MTLGWIVLSKLAGGVLSVAVAASLTVSLLSRIVQHLVSLSTGVLLATALLGILPEAFESQASPQALFGTLLGGLMFFFLLEKAELYRHSHHYKGDEHHHHRGFDRRQAGRCGWSVILGDSIHNFCDGIIIAAAFLADTRVGKEGGAGHHRPRDPAGSRRLHRSAQRRLFPWPRALLQRLLGIRRGHRRRHRVLRRRAVARDASLSPRDRVEQLHLRLGRRPDSAASASPHAEGDGGAAALGSSRVSASSCSRSRNCTGIDCVRHPNRVPTGPIRA
jgi:hypothetical protein